MGEKIAADGGTVLVLDSVLSEPVAGPERGRRVELYYLEGTGFRVKRFGEDAVDLGGGGGAIDGWSTDPFGSFIPDNAEGQDIGSSDFPIRAFYGDVYKLETLDSAPEADAARAQVYSRLVDDVSQLFAVDSEGGDYQLTPPTGSETSPFTSSAGTIRPINLASKLIFGDTVMLPSIEATYDPMWRFTKSSTKSLTLMVDNSAVSGQAGALIAANNDMGVGCGVFSLSSGWDDSEALGLVAHDVGLFVLTAKDIDPDTDFGMCFYPGLANIKWFTQFGATSEKMRMVSSPTALLDGALLLGRKTPLVDEKFYVGRDNLNYPMRAYFQNAYVGNASDAVVGCLNENATGAMLFSINPTGPSDPFTPGDAGIYFDGETGAHAPEADASLVFLSGISAPHARKIKWGTGGSFHMTMAADGGLLLGDPTGGSQGPGTINVDSNFYVNGNPFAPFIGPDALENGGSSFGVPITVGANDTFPISLLVDGQEKAKLTVAGSWLIGVDALAHPLDDGNCLLDIRKDSSVVTYTSIRNMTDGVNSRAQMVIIADPDVVGMELGATGPSWASVSEPGLEAGISFIRSGGDNGIIMMTSNSSPIKFKTNGDHTWLQIDGDGKMAFNGVATVARPTIVDNGASIGDALVALGLVIDGR